MLKKILDVETENTETSSNESLDLLPAKSNDIPAAERDFCPPAEVLQEEREANKAIGAEQLDPVTAGALRLRYRIFNGENNIRMVLDDRKNVWFVADDICKILGYKNTTKAVADHCGKVIDSKYIDERHSLAKKITVKDANGHDQAMLAINEPDTYRLILRSRMPDAIRFEKWVMEDVLPSIRKTSKYAVKRKIDYAPATNATTVAPAEESAQFELFPNMMPSMTFPKPLTEKINAAKLKLYNEGHTFPNNKEFVKFLITRALEDLEG